MTRCSCLMLTTALMAGLALSAQAPPPGDGPMGPGCPPPMAGPGRPGPMGLGPGPGPRGQGPEAGPQGPSVLRFLNLTEAQQKAVRAIQDQHRAELKARRRALGEKAEAVRDGLEDPAVPDARLRALVAEEGEARLQLALAERSAFQETNAVLTAEQQAKAQRLRQKLQKERAAHREVVEEMGGPMGPGM